MVLPESKNNQQKKKPDKVKLPQNVSFDPTNIRYTDSVGNEVKDTLRKVVKHLIEPGKGILAVDESPEQFGARLEQHGIENNHPNRVGHVVSLLGESEAWRMYVSGVLLHDDIFQWLRHKDVRKKVFPGLEERGIYVGVKKDGHVPVAGTQDELTATGLDTLPAHCLDWKEKGVSFVVMSCMFDIGEYTPSSLTYIANATTLARSASICQRAGLVPVVSLKIARRCSGLHDEFLPQELDPIHITQDILASVIKALADHHIYLEGTLLQMTPVLPINPGVKSVTKETLKAIIDRVPPALGGVLIDECQDFTFSTEVLNQITLTLCPKPCPVSFLWGEVITKDLPAVWKGKEDNKHDVTMVMADRLKICSQATMGHLPKDQHFIFVTKIADDPAYFVDNSKGIPVSG